MRRWKGIWHAAVRTGRGTRWRALARGWISSSCSRDADYNWRGQWECVKDRSKLCDLVSVHSPASCKATRWTDYIAAGGFPGQHILQKEHFKAVCQNLCGLRSCHRMKYKADLKGRWILQSPGERRYWKELRLRRTISESCDWGARKAGSTFAGKMIARSVWSSEVLREELQLQVCLWSTFEHFTNKWRRG